ncbi:MAG TPA: hypothetical protein VHS79_17445, partial [Actinomycetes bacterium]|nr:hypothetical protein [Actinomycetes bacterium]
MNHRSRGGSPLKVIPPLDLRCQRLGLAQLLAAQAPAVQRREAQLLADQSMAAQLRAAQLRASQASSAQLLAAQLRAARSPELQARSAQLRAAQLRASQSTAPPGPDPSRAPARTPPQDHWRAAQPAGS